MPYSLPAKHCWPSTKPASKTSADLAAGQMPCLGTQAMTMTKYAVDPGDLTKEAQDHQEQLKCSICNKPGHQASEVQGQLVCPEQMSEALKNGK